MIKEIDELYKLYKKRGFSSEELTPYFDKLKELNIKEYGLLWEKEQINHSESVVPNAKLLEDYCIKDDNDETEKVNVLLEGDNYDSLLFLKSHHKLYDLVYLDPPYNTGNKSFVYTDNYSDTEHKWSHSAWLTFMEKRLKLSKDLLAEDGFICISIDENEQAHLKLLCDEIFGEKNFVSMVSRLTSTSPKMDTKYLASNLDYIFIYAKDITKLRLNRADSDNESSYKLEDEYVSERGPHQLNPLGRGSLRYTRSLDYAIEAPDGTLIYPGGGKGKNKWVWRWSKDKVEWGKESGFILFKKTKGEWNVYSKQYLKVNNKGEEIGRTKPFSNMLTEYTNEQGKVELKNLNMDNLFSYPKPLSLLKWVINLHPGKDIKVLDFFAGSGTTGAAVMELNKEDGGTRSYTLCTNNEISDARAMQYLMESGLILGKTKKELLTSYKGYQGTKEYKDWLQSDHYESLGICKSVTYARLRKVIEGYTTPKGKEIAGLGGNLSYYKIVK